MATNKRKRSGASKWTELSGTLQACVPHLQGVLADEEGFIELRLKMRDDMTVLAVLKRYGPDGGPMVCFGSGYGVSGALMAIDGTVNAGDWRVDRPWADRKK